MDKKNVSITCSETNNQQQPSQLPTFLPSTSSTGDNPPPETHILPSGVNEANRDLHVEAGYRSKMFELCDGLGFESSSEKTSSSDLSLLDEWATAAGPRSESRSRSAFSRGGRRTLSESVLERGLRRSSSGSLEGFPPLLSTLGETGRPRFVLERTRSQGRLVIVKKRESRRSVVRTMSAENVVSMALLDNVPDDLEDIDEAEGANANE